MEPLSGSGQGLRLSGARNRKEAFLAAGNVLQRYFQAAVLPARSRTTTRRPPAAGLHVPRFGRTILFQRSCCGVQKVEKETTTIQLQGRTVAGDYPERTRRPTPEKGTDVPFESNGRFGILHGCKGSGNLGATRPAPLVGQTVRRQTSCFPAGGGQKVHEDDCRPVGFGAGGMDLFVSRRPIGRKQFLFDRRTPGLVRVGRGPWFKAEDSEHERPS
mmetsp:Transcript_24212/g.67067  ORF Transcript_24212/g.67067 Transcript_24212/m.67067 type:complete len:216 (-) Transcript_24212:687-1334(-)